MMTSAAITGKAVTDCEYAQELSLYNTYYLVVPVPILVQYLTVHIENNKKYRVSEYDTKDVWFI
jgi:hypothetical protein